MTDAPPTCPLAQRLHGTLASTGESKRSEREGTMAERIHSTDWMEIEQSICRQVYWQHVIEGWLWQGPFSVVVNPDPPTARRAELPTPQALQHYGWLKEPHSTHSH
jgi:hypothetical protein